MFEIQRRGRCSRRQGGRHRDLARHGSRNTLHRLMLRDEPKPEDSNVENVRSRRDNRGSRCGRHQEVSGAWRAQRAAPIRERWLRMLDFLPGAPRRRRDRKRSNVLPADQRCKTTMTTSIDRNGSVARRVAAVVTAACLTAFAGGAPAPIATAAAATAAAVAPRNAIDGILEAFAEYDVVALGEGPHGNEPGHRFRVSLIRDPRFTARVHDIVVEFGNARYQEVMNRYLAGEDVPRVSLRRVWRTRRFPARSGMGRSTNDSSPTCES